MVRRVFLASIFLIGIGFVCLSFIANKVYAGRTCRYVDCPGNPGCIPAPGNRCKAGTCIECTETKPPEEPRCERRTCGDYTRGCGLPVQTLSNGCGGTISCPATAPCATPTPTPIPACVDSDGGNAPGVAGVVTIIKPIPQKLADSCLTLKTIHNADGSTSSQWIQGTTGTHVGEKTCTNTTTGAYADTVYACQYKCSNGACNSATSCGLRSSGDANCDNVVNDADYTIWKTKMRGGAYTSTSYSADFDKDGAVTIVDYEIWRTNRFN